MACDSTPGTREPSNGKPREPSSGNPQGARRLRRPTVHRHPISHRAKEKMGKMARGRLGNPAKAAKWEDSWSLRTSREITTAGHGIKVTAIIPTAPTCTDAVSQWARTSKDATRITKASTISDHPLTENGPRKIGLRLRLKIPGSTQQKMTTKGNGKETPHLTGQTARGSPLKAPGGIQLAQHANTVKLMTSCLSLPGKSVTSEKSQSPLTSTPPPQNPRRDPVVPVCSSLALEPGLSHPGSRWVPPRKHRVKHLYQNGFTFLISYTKRRTSST